MNLDINEDLFQSLYPLVLDPSITDIKWNGRSLHITDLQKGRYHSDILLTENFLSIFTARISNLMSVNFNQSKPSLMAETEELRIHAIHSTRTADKKTMLAIRKTPSICRISQNSMIETGYADRLTQLLMESSIRANLSIIIIGDTGSGKTELEKYLCGFIPDNEPTLTVEDTLEMKLAKLYPNKEVQGLKVDDKYPVAEAIRDALRLNIKRLVIAEARGRDFLAVLEGVSACKGIVSIHCDNTWEVPDRCVQMVGDEGSSTVENDVYTFFDLAIKVKAEFTADGVNRKIDQLCFFERVNQENWLTVIMEDGMFTKKPLPKAILKKFAQNKEQELLSLLEKRIEVKSKE